MSTNNTLSVNYCTNCDNLPVCKYATLITQFDTLQKQFNTTNATFPIRISVVSINYNCKHKDPILKL